MKRIVILLIAVLMANGFGGILNSCGGSTLNHSPAIVRAADGFSNLPKIPNPIFVDYIDADEWADSSMGTEAAETTIVKCGLESTRYTTASTTGARGCSRDYGAGGEKNFNGCTMHIRYYLDSAFAAGMNLAPNLPLQLIFYDDTGTTNKWTLAYLPTAVGWNEYSFSAGMGTFAGTMTDWSSVRKVYLVFNVQSAGYFVLDEFSAYPHGRTKGAVIFQFDDGIETAYTNGIRYLAKYGFPSMWYISGQYLSETDATRQTNTTYGDYAIWPEIKYAETLGCLICTHAQTAMPTTSKAALRAWCKKNKDYLLDRGYTDGAGYLAIPGGQVLWNGTLTEQEMMDTGREYFLHIRGTQPWWQNAHITAVSGTNGCGAVTVQPYLQKDNRWGWAQSDITSAAAIAKIDKAIKYKDVYGLFIHNLTDATALTTAEFREIVDYVYAAVQDGTLEVITYADMLNDSTLADKGIKTVVTTIGWDGAAGTEFVFTAAANITAQNIDLGAIIPAYARVLDISVICKEALAPDDDLTFALGPITGTDTFIAAAQVDDLNNTIGMATGSTPIAAISTAASNVWIQVTPTTDDDSHDFEDMTAGKWKIKITYID